jgi:hypothetical protein
MPPTSPPPDRPHLFSGSLPSLAPPITASHRYNLAVVPNLPSRSVEKKSHNNPQNPKSAVAVTADDNPPTTPPPRSTMKMKILHLCCPPSWPQAGLRLRIRISELPSASALESKSCRWIWAPERSCTHPHAWPIDTLWIRTHGHTPPKEWVA